MRQSWCTNEPGRLSVHRIGRVYANSRRDRAEPTAYRKFPRDPEHPTGRQPDTGPNGQGKPDIDTLRPAAGVRCPGPNLGGVRPSTYPVSRDVDGWLTCEGEIVAYWEEGKCRVYYADGNYGLHGRTVAQTVNILAEGIREIAR